MSLVGPWEWTDPTFSLTLYHELLISLSCVADMMQYLNVLATNAYFHHTFVSILLLKKILYYKRLFVRKKIYLN